MKISMACVLIAVLAGALPYSSASAEDPGFAVVVDGGTLFTASDVVSCNWRDFEFTLADTSVERICEIWNCGLRPATNNPTRFSVVVGDTALFAGRVQMAWSSYLPTGPLMQWPPIPGSNSLRIFAALEPGLEPAKMEIVKGALLKAGVKLE